MMNSRTKIIFLTLALTFAMTGVATAQNVIWDQTEGYESWSMGFFNVIAGAPPMGMVMYTVNDVVVPSEGWTIDTIKIYYDGFNPGWAGALTTGIMYLEAKTGSMPTGDPTITGTVVTVNCVLLANGFLEVSTTGLDLALTEGEYWIGLTPDTPNADNIHVGVAAVGDASPTFDPFGFPGGWSNWAPDLDGAMLIEGMGPVSTEAVSLGSVKALFR